MNKILSFIIFLALTISGAFAQTKPASQLSFGAEFGFPTGRTASIYGSVIGGSTKLEIPVSSSSVFLTLTSGFSIYMVKLTYTGNASAAAFIDPLEVGGKYYFSKLGYFEGDVGASSEINSNYSAAKTALIFAPIIGFSAPTSKHKATIDISLRGDCRVESDGMIAQIAARVAYRFGLK